MYDYIISLFIKNSIKKETNRRILDAGFSMFSRMSIDKVSMENVADEAGIGIATLYRYYRTKSELVVAVGTHF